MTTYTEREVRLAMGAISMVLHYAQDEYIENGLILGIDILQDILKEDEKNQ